MNKIIMPLIMFLILISVGYGMFYEDKPQLVITKYDGIEAQIYSDIQIYSYTKDSITIRASVDQQQKEEIYNSKDTDIKYKDYIDNGFPVSTISKDMSKQIELEQEFETKTTIKTDGDVVYFTLYGWKIGDTIKIGDNTIQADILGSLNGYTDFTTSGGFAVNLVNGQPIDAVFTSLGGNAIFNSSFGKIIQNSLETSSTNTSTNSYYEIGPSEFGTAITNHSVSFWIYPKSQAKTAMGLWHNRGSNNGNYAGQFIQREGTQLVIGYGLGIGTNRETSSYYGYVDAATYLPNDQWTHITGIFSSTNFTLYINGEEMNLTYGGTVGTLSIDGRYIIGASRAGFSYLASSSDAFFSEWGIWRDYYLNNTEVLYLYNNSIGCSYNFSNCFSSPIPTNITYRFDNTQVDPMSPVIYSAGSNTVFSTELTVINTNISYVNLSLGMNNYVANTLDNITFTYNITGLSPGVYEWYFYGESTDNIYNESQRFNYTVIDPSTLSSPYTTIIDYNHRNFICSIQINELLINVDEVRLDVYRMNSIIYSNILNNINVGVYGVEYRGIFDYAICTYTFGSETLQAIYQFQKEDEAMSIYATMFLIQFLIVIGLFLFNLYNIMTYGEFFRNWYERQEERKRNLSALGIGIITTIIAIIFWGVGMVVTFNNFLEPIYVSLYNLETWLVFPFLIIMLGLQIFIYLSQYVKLGTQTRDRYSSNNRRY